MKLPINNTSQSARFEIGFARGPLFAFLAERVYLRTMEARYWRGSALDISPRPSLRESKVGELRILSVKPIP